MNKGLAFTFILASTLFIMLFSAGFTGKTIVEKRSTADNNERLVNMPQTKCPVMGGHIDQEMYVDVKGKRIYICCMACEDAIKAEPEKYIKKIEARGETVETLAGLQ